MRHNAVVGCQIVTNLNAGAFECMEDYSVFDHGIFTNDNWGSFIGANGN
jgi:hypothetical protein